MRYLFINSVYGRRSTGRIVAGKCRELIAAGNQCVAAYGREAIDGDAVPQIQIGKKRDYLWHALISRLFGLHGFCSKKATQRFLQQIERYAPDVIWLHNLHGYYINVELLFCWLKAHPEIQVVWTLHDCWAFTGHCAYFTMARCEKWKTQCHCCSQLKTYPQTSFFENTGGNFRRKQAAFTGIKNLLLITPSEWLAILTRESFLKEYPVKVIHNMIDVAVFKPTPSDFRLKYHLENKYIILGVAIGWEETKGFQDMLALRGALSDKYVLVLVGIRKKQLSTLKPGMIGIERTENQEELAAIYTAADVFVNPTHQDNYPTVNLEAQACGTPAVTYDVGGSPESVPPENVIEEGDIQALASRIVALCAQGK